MRVSLSERCMVACLSISLLLMVVLEVLAAGFLLGLVPAKWPITCGIFTIFFASLTIPFMLIEVVKDMKADRGRAS